MTTTEEVRSWFSSRLPAEWFTGELEVTFDDDEILVVGRLAQAPAGESNETREALDAARIRGFRDETRERRIEVAREAQRTFRRAVSWGATCGDVRRLFTTARVPVGTRLGLEQRAVLDTLVRAGVAKSRGEALAVAVRLLAENETSWLKDLRDALAHVDEVRAERPVAL